MSIAYIQSILPALLAGTKQTLQIFFLTLIFSLPLGLVVALGTMSRVWPIKMVSKFYVWVFRGTPLMLQLFFFFYFLPIFTPFTLDRLPTAVITFVLNYAAYFGEIYRGGIQSIDRGQREAARSLGFSPWQTMKMIVIPQAVRRVIPPVSNEVITLIKDTALVYVLGVPELLKAAKDANNRDSNPTSYLLAAIIYLFFTFLLTLFAQKMEQHFSRHERKEPV